MHDLEGMYFIGPGRASGRVVVLLMHCHSDLCFDQNRGERHGA